jgi:hypothetical protein
MSTTPDNDPAYTTPDNAPLLFHEKYLCLYPNFKDKAWCPKPRHYSIKASLGTGLGNAPFRWRLTQAGQLRGSPPKTALRASGNPFQTSIFRCAQNRLETGCPKRSRTMKLSFAGDFRG